MKIYSDTLTRTDLYASLPDDVYAKVITMKRPRKRANGWIVSLEGLGPRHNRRKNSGSYGAAGPMAATWDDHGVWMAKLFDLDPYALIANYDGRDDFEEQTRAYREYVRTYNKPTSQRWQQHQAPWLQTSSAR